MFRVHEIGWLQVIYFFGIGLGCLWAVVYKIRRLRQERQARIEAAYEALRAELDEEELDDGPVAVTIPPMTRKEKVRTGAALLGLALLSAVSFVLGVPAFKVAYFAHRGNRLLNQREYEPAAVAYRQALGADPAAMDLYNYFGTAQTLYNRREGGLKQALQEVKSRPNDPIAHSDLGTAMMGRNEIAGAIQEYKRAIDLSPNTPLLHNNLGNAYAKQHDLINALDEYQKTLKLDPDLSPVCYNMANVLVGLKRISEAVPVYRRAIALNPKLAPAYYNLARVLHAQGDRAEAISLLQQFRSLAQNDPNYAQFDGMAQKDLQSWLSGK